MNSIMNLIKDPSWWFSAVIIGIIGSIVAGFIKDYLSKILALFSNKIRSKREKKSEQAIRQIELLASNPDLLIIKLLTTLLRFSIFISTLVLCGICQSMYMSLFIGSEVQSMIKLSYYTKDLYAVMTIITGFISIYAGYRSTLNFGILMSAISKFTQKFKYK